eukprot:9478130-Pyramimonas_sp.AAC.1
MTCVGVFAMTEGLTTGLCPKCLKREKNIRRIHVLYPKIYTCEAGEQIKGLRRLPCPCETMSAPDPGSTSIPRHPALSILP